jgi:glycosyltransferase involved in cell wall biosynthesis
MKILVIVHQFPPKESAGTEVYAYKLAKGLQNRGHDMTVFYTQRYPGRAQYDVNRGEFDGLSYYEVVNNHEFSGRFRGIYKDERMEEHLRHVLDEVQPDAVHIQHLHLHSIDYVGIIKSRGIPVLYTLAEYLNICPRNGWLAKLDFTLCDGPETNECAKCAAGLWPPPGGWESLHQVPAPPPAEKATPAPAVVLEPRVHAHSPPYKKVSFKRFVAKLKRFVAKLKRKLSGQPEPASQPAARPVVEPAPAPHVAEPVTAAPPPENPWIPAVDLYWKEHKAQLDQVDLFIAPSNFLREQFIKCGMIEPERIVYSDYGFDHAPFEKLGAPPKRDDGILRVGFIGSIAEQKGVHLIVEAFNDLPEEGVECLIYGGLTGFPDYVAECRAQRRHVGVRFMGRYVNTKIGEVLQSIDVLVIPSRWFENSPLTIHESFMAGVPVITGNRGGMAELVDHEVSGLHFEVGSADDLRRQILRLMKEPELLERMRKHMPKVKTVDEDAEETEARLEKLVGQGVAAG